MSDAAAVRGCQIWIAAGTYAPTQSGTDSTDPRDATLRLHDGIELFGGFAGYEASLDERVENENQTSISGEVGDSSGTDNIKRLITSSGSVRLDSLIVRDAYSETEGAGIACLEGSLVLDKVVFNDNRAGTAGGALSMTSDCEVLIRNSYFNGNSASSTTPSTQVRGGAIRNLGGTLSIEATTFYNNSSEGAARGGAIYARGGSTTIEASSFTLNHVTSSSAADVYGGAIYHESVDASVATVTDCSFEANSAGFIDDAPGHGGAIAGSQLRIEQSIFFMNAAQNADSSGGAVFGNGDVTVRDSEFSQNETELAFNSGGGAIHVQAGRLELLNVELLSNRAWKGGAVWCSQACRARVQAEFALNAAENAGGALYFDGDSLEVTNSWLSTNSTKVTGAGLYVDAPEGTASVSLSTIVHHTLSSPYTSMSGVIHHVSGELLISNSILWGGSDTWPEIQSLQPDAVTVRFSNLSAVTAGEGNFSDVPLFADGGRQLASDSTSVDAGSNALVPADTFDLDADGNVAEPVPLDAAGNPRIAGSAVDVGAYETTATQ